MPAPWRRRSHADQLAAANATLEARRAEAERAEAVLRTAQDGGAGPIELRARFAELDRAFAAAWQASRKVHAGLTGDLTRATPMQRLRATRRPEALRAAMVVDQLGMARDQRRLEASALPGRVPIESVDPPRYFTDDVGLAEAAVASGVPAIPTPVAPAGEH